MLSAARRRATAAEIAADLRLSEGTVRNYLSAAIRKLRPGTAATRFGPRRRLAVARRGGGRSAVRNSTAVPAAERIEIRRLQPAEIRAELDRLAAVLLDCVEGGASVSYMAPFTHEQAREAFDGFAAEVEGGRRLLLAAFEGTDLVGTVQVILAVPPNQPHRAEIAKLLVRRSARRRGVARRLMERAEKEAQTEGKTLLVLDTVTGDGGERLYETMGWTRVGVIPGYALYPDGRPCDTTVFWKSV